MLSRRSFALAGAISLANLGQAAHARQEPVASPIASPRAGTWQVVDHRSLELDGQPCALSPDGAWIAGVDGENLVLWETASLEPTVVPTGVAPEPAAIAWAPDSSALAFSSSIITSNLESDLHCYDLAAGALTPLTPDNATTGFPAPDEEGPRPNDLFPAWSPDGQSLVFARSNLDRDSAMETTIASIPRAGGEAQVLATVADWPAAIYSSLFPQADGSVYYTYIPMDREDEHAGIWRLSPDRATSHLVRPDAMPFGTIITAVAAREAGTTVYASAMNRDAGSIGEAIQSFAWDIEGDSAILRDPLGSPETPLTVHEIGPDGRSLAAVRWEPGSTTVLLIDGVTGDTTTLADLPGAGFGESPGFAGFPFGLVNWAGNDTVLVDIPGAGPQLVTIAPA